MENFVGCGGLQPEPGSCVVVYRTSFLTNTWPFLPTVALGQQRDVVSNFFNSGRIDHHDIIYDVGILASFVF